MILELEVEYEILRKAWLLSVQEIIFYSLPTLGAFSSAIFQYFNFPHILNWLLFLFSYSKLRLLESKKINMRKSTKNQIVHVV